MPARLPPLADAISIHLLRFVIMLVTLEVAAWVGVTGWYLGLLANVVLTVAAVVIMTRRGLWRSSGMLTRWRSRLAALALIPLAAEALSWLVPGGFENRAPGAWLWALTLLLVGLNEEMFSRGIVLDRLARAYRPVKAVLWTAALFGLQHLSALALTDRGVGDVLGNVVLSAIYGLALASFQLRFRWLWPLVIVHGLADWTTILAPRHYSDAIIGAWQVVFIGYGVWLLRGMSRTAGTSVKPERSLAG